MLTRQIAFHAEKRADLGFGPSHSEPSQTLYGHLILIVLFALAIVLRAVL